MFNNSKININSTEYNNIILQLLNDRGDVIESKSIQPELKSIFKNNNLDIKEYEQRKIIFDFKKQLENKGEIYSDVQSKFSINTINKNSDNLIEVNGIEETYMYIENTNDKTGYTAKHQFIFEMVNGELVLVEDRQLEPSGLLPLQEAEKFVYK